MNIKQAFISFHLIGTGFPDVEKMRFNYSVDYLVADTAIVTTASILLAVAERFNATNLLNLDIDPKQIFVVNLAVLN